MDMEQAKVIEAEINLQLLDEVISMSEYHTNHSGGPRKKLYGKLLEAAIDLQQELKKDLYAKDKRISNSKKRK